MQTLTSCSKVSPKCPSQASFNLQKNWCITHCERRYSQPARKPTPVQQRDIQHQSWVRYSTTRVSSICTLAPNARLNHGRTDQPYCVIVPQALDTERSDTPHREAPRKSGLTSQQSLAKWCSGCSDRETRGEKGVLPTVFPAHCSDFQETLQFMLRCRDALLLNHPCWKQIADICETQCGRDQFLKMSGTTV